MREPSATLFRAFFGSRVGCDKKANKNRPEGKSARRARLRGLLQFAAWDRDHRPLEEYLFALEVDVAPSPSHGAELLVHGRASK